MGFTMSVSQLYNRWPIDISPRCCDGCVLKSLPLQNTFTQGRQITRSAPLEHTTNGPSSSAELSAHSPTTTSISFWKHHPHRRRASGLRTSPWPPSRSHPPRQQHLPPPQHRQAALPAAVARPGGRERLQHRLAAAVRQRLQPQRPEHSRRGVHVAHVSCFFVQAGASRDARPECNPRDTQQLNRGPFKLCSLLPVAGAIPTWSTRRF